MPNHGFLDEISGIEHLGETPTRRSDYRLGESLINDTAAPVIQVRYEDLYPCKKNAKMSKPQEKIDALADSIAREGLLAPLVVAKRNLGKFEILSGETRYLAIGLLRERGVWKETDPVEVRVFDVNKIDMPLPKEMKEDYARRTANIARDKTADDYYLEINEWRDMIEELKKQGVESLPTPGAKGEDSGIRITGEKMADIIAKIVGLSNKTVQQYLVVEDKGEPEIQDSLMNGAMSPHVAAAAARSLPPEEQKQFAEEAGKKKSETGKKATRDDLETFRKGQEEKKQKEEEAEEPERWIMYDRDRFYGDLQPLVDFFDANPSPQFYMSAPEHRRVLKQMAALEELFAKHMNK